MLYISEKDKLSPLKWYIGIANEINMKKNRKWPWRWLDLFFLIRTNYTLIDRTNYGVNNGIFIFKIENMVKKKKNGLKKLNSMQTQFCKNLKRNKIYFSEKNNWKSFHPPTTKYSQLFHCTVDAKNILPKIARQYTFAHHCPNCHS